MNRKILLSFVIMILFFGNGCNIRQNPEDVIEKLETAFNTSNIDMMLECYEPSIQQMYKGIMEIGGQMLGGVDLATVVSGLGGFANIFGETYGHEMPTVKLTVTDKEVVSENKVKLNVTQEYFWNNPNLSNNLPDKVNEIVYMVNIDGNWYISAKGY